MTIRVWALFIEVMDYCWRERRTVLRYGLLPFLIASVALLLMPDLRSPETPQMTKLMSAFAAMVVQLVVYLPMTVTWYRMVVVNHDQALRRPVFTLGRTEGRLLLWQILIGVLAGVAALIGAMVIGVIYFLLDKMLGRGVAGGFAVLACLAGFVMLLVLMTRLTFAVVLAATDQPASLRTAWTLTEGISWRITLVFLLIFLAYMLAVAAAQLVVVPVSMVVAMAVGSTAGKIATSLVGVLSAGLGVVLVVALATLFGLVYRRVMEAQVAAELAPHVEAVPIP